MSDRREREDPTATDGAGADAPERSRTDDGSASGGRDRSPTTDHGESDGRGRPAATDGGTPTATAGSPVRDTAAEDSPMADYEVSNYFPRSREFTKDERKRLRNHYGWVRTYFKTRPQRYASVQRWLNQARIGTTYDRYLTTSVHYALLATLLGVLAGVGVSYYLDLVGVLPTLRSPVRIPGEVGTFVSANRLAFAAGGITVISALTLGVGTWTARYYYPRFLVGERARAIDLMLPHTITYMYALSYGGMNLIEVIENVADSTDTYDEVANEFEMIVRDMDVFGSDLLTAVRNARNVTPSDSLERFLDDLLSTMDAGGDTNTFFEEQSDKYLKEAKERQEYFLETLELLSELFIFAFIAAPLFVVVTLMVISFLGGNTLLQMAVLIYVGLPLGMLAFIILIDVLSAPYVQPGGRLDIGEILDVDDLPDDVRDDQRFGNYRKARRRKRLVGSLRNPLTAVEQRPILSLVASVPLGIAFAAGAVLQGATGASVEAFSTTPVATTTLLVVVPVLIASVPLSYFYERKRRRENLIAERFPDTLNILSSANAMGIRLTDALGLVSRYSTGTLAVEMRKVRNDVQWNHDLRRALLLLGNRLKVPYLARTIKLLADGGRSSGDLTRILSIAAEDTRNRARIERERRQAMVTYIAIVVIGFLVYLMVIVLIDSSYLAPFAELAEQQRDLPPERQVPGSFTQIPLETYRALFFHSVLIQGFGAGLLAGKLSDNDILAGLKYSIALVVLSVVVFLFI